MILKKIWTGNRSIASQIRLDHRQSKLPDDIYGFIVVSRWALARAYLEAKKSDARTGNGKPTFLTLGLKKIGKEICSATATMGRVDSVEEMKSISEIDFDIGCTSSQTEELMRCLHEFSMPNDRRGASLL